jgi:hypothetical protein
MVADGKVIIHIVVPEKLKTWLKDQAKAENRSLSNYSSLLLERAWQEDLTKTQTKPQQIAK